MFALVLRMSLSAQKITTRACKKTENVFPNLNEKNIHQNSLSYVFGDVGDFVICTVNRRFEWKQ